MGRTHPAEVPVDCTRQSGGWVCVYTNLISPLKMLLFVCTVGELDFFPSIEMILSYLYGGYQYLFYFKGARFNFVINLKCLPCVPFKHSTDFF